MSQCPVCGAPRKSTGADCPGCGFEFAFAEAFASISSRQQWESEAARRRQRLLSDRMRRRSGLSVLDRQIACSEDNSIRRFSAAGDPAIIPNAVQVSCGRTHELMLMRDGRVTATGSNRLGQCIVQDVKRAAAVLAGPNASYILLRDGRVQARGVCPFAGELAAWREIRALACGNEFLAGLGKDGSVRVVGAPFAGCGAWKNIQSIAAADDYLLALDEGGNVHFAGPENDPRARATEWKDVTAIAAEDMYAVGLTRDGRVLLAGEGGWLDRGRSEAGQWTNITAIAAGHGAIAALDAAGRLHIAGESFASAAGRERIIAQWAHG